MASSTPLAPVAGNRRYSDEDIAVLRRISELASEGMNLEGIRRVMSLEMENSRLRTELEQAREIAQHAIAAAEGRRGQWRRPRAAASGRRRVRAASVDLRSPAALTGLASSPAVQVVVIRSATISPRRRCGMIRPTRRLVGVTGRGSAFGGERRHPLDGPRPLDVGAGRDDGSRHVDRSDPPGEPAAPIAAPSATHWRVGARMSCTDNGG